MEASKSDSKFLGIIRKIDAFSMPFQFSLCRQEKTCKTLVGGFVTFIVYSISLAYFIYITNLYFTTGYQPKVSTIDLFQENIPFQVSNDSFAFNFFIQYRGNIQQLENETGKKYLSFLIYYQYFDSDGNLKNMILNTVKCQDNSLSEYLCIDFTSLPSPINIKYNQLQSSINQEGFQIVYLQCKGSENCASDQDIADILYNPYNGIQFSIKLERYNTINQYVETVRQIKSYVLDQFVGTRHLVQLIQSKTMLIEGFILQKRLLNNYLDSFEEVSEIKWLQSLQQQTQLPIIGEIVISMSTKQRFITIQFPLYTETFAQFFSVFALLTFLGKIGYTFSEIEIYQEISNLFLKKYYKQTAFKAYYEFFTKSNQEAEQQNQNTEKQTLKDAQEILNVNQKISKIFFPKKMFQFLNLGIIQKLQIYLKKEIPLKFLEKKPTQLKQIHNIMKNTHKYANLIEFYKDIIQVKIIVRLLLTKEQFSAIKYCGLDIQKVKQQQIKEYLPDIQKFQEKQSAGTIKSNKDVLLTDLQQTSKQVKLYIDQKEEEFRIQGQFQQNTTEQINFEKITEQQTTYLNHLEQIEKIDQDDNISQQYFIKYLKNMQQKDQISELDQRILNSLIQVQEKYQSQDNQFNLQI
ncbi:kinase domain protein (macronuclear) [Tetrahymena thermophila SB210]|uniref:Kinase domain protein n=1 Tax=Tetrahymena thermophila (strain SB210) TaxID=312017 RepID=W7XL53_TETTS|nr:kinase domain protein [Tetrahymena thermophila SB210]EWS75689.1 kinase domain protein [Tetrahymena thermophila SB210]|eukprot:XP_012651762.1 kinase domain protein [Tetrahymena thermophila SB210]